MNCVRKSLPLGDAEFVNIRKDGSVYVDKTAILQELIANGRWYFLARPRRFGKTLTVSTFEAMFQGKRDLFTDLAAAAWVQKQAEHPCPVLRFDMSTFDSSSAGDCPEAGVHLWLNLCLKAIAEEFGLNTPVYESSAYTFVQLMKAMHKKYGQCVVLIDEYDAPMLNYISEPKKASAVRSVFRSFYSSLKSCGKYIRFVFITGITRIVKSGIFSSLNNLNDISFDKKYGTIVGYTENELLNNFEVYMQDAAQSISVSELDLKEKIANFYDGYSFDGSTSVYNPFSILSFFSKNEFANYWYESGSPTFLYKYFSEHNIQSYDQYQNVSVDISDFAEKEIEETTPECFLYQAGYLTIAERNEEQLILKYPNQEVLSALAKLCLKMVYDLRDPGLHAKKLWAALRSSNIVALVKAYNAALASVPYFDFSHADEYLFRSLMLMLLRGAGVECYGEVPTCTGRSDILISCNDFVLVIEFKLARSASEVKSKLCSGEKQVEARGYLAPYLDEARRKVACVLVVGDLSRQVIAWSCRSGTLYEVHGVD